VLELTYEIGVIFLFNWINGANGPFVACFVCINLCVSGYVITVWLQGWTESCLSWGLVGGSLVDVIVKNLYFEKATRRPLLPPILALLIQVNFWQTDTSCTVDKLYVPLKFIIVSQLLRFSLLLHHNCMQVAKGCTYLHSKQARALWAVFEMLDFVSELWQCDGHIGTFDCCSSVIKTICLQTQQQQKYSSFFTDYSWRPEAWQCSAFDSGRRSLCSCLSYSFLSYSTWHCRRQPHSAWKVFGGSLSVCQGEWGATTGGATWIVGKGDPRLTVECYECTSIGCHSAQPLTYWCWLVT
jgi:hypothetical protein